MTKTDVACYAGAAYPERPRQFLYQGRWLEVVEVERRERTPHGPRFQVRVGDGRRFWLRYHEHQDAWDVQASGRSPEPGGSP